MSMWSKRSGIMLAYPFNEGRIKRNFTYPILVQPKLNGERCRALCFKGSRVDLLSSEENLITSVPHVQKALAYTNLPGLELDGELYRHGWSKQKIRSIVSRRKALHEEHEEVTYNCFDLIIDEPQLERLNLLYTHVKPQFKKWDCLDVVETTPCDSLEVAEALLCVYMEEEYEGIILRDMRAPYQRKRVTTMLKWKPRKSDCYLIVGYSEEIDQYGEPKNALGALVLSSDVGETFSVGTGSYFTRERRISLWQDKDNLINKYAVIKYPELTERGIPFHPVIVDISSVYVEDDDE